MKKFFVTALSMALFAAVNFECHGKNFRSQADKNEPFTVTHTIPIYGNAYVTAGTVTRGGVSVDNQEGIRNWTDPESVISIYFHVDKPGSINLALYGISPESSTITASVNGETFSADALMTSAGMVMLGTTELTKAGYVRVDLKGVNRSGVDFGKYTALKIGGPATEGGKVTYVPSEPASANWPYWGRRGPSVHCQYDISGIGDVRWFYNELTVPEGQDPPGIYAMANGFTGGYMGIQVAADGGRRVLFSVWSTYNTNNPQDIPEEYRVVKMRQGQGVTVKDFGNEGSGGQSFMDYPWEAGKTYKFLTEAVYDAATNSTTFTGYFCGHDGVWRLISSLRQPHPSAKTYSGSHSFLENFQPTKGWVDRRVNFSNQWARTASGEWHEVSKATFTYDDTARNGIRLDYAGWADGDGFWLRNCGFFDNNTPYRTVMVRTDTTGTPPEIDFDALSRL